MQKHIFCQAILNYNWTRWKTFRNWKWLGFCEATFFLETYIKKILPIAVIIVQIFTFWFFFKGHHSEWHHPLQLKGIKCSVKSQREGTEKAFNVPIAIFISNSPIIKTALIERTAYYFTKQILIKTAWLTYNSSIIPAIIFLDGRKQKKYFGSPECHCTTTWISHPTYPIRCLFFLFNLWCLVSKCT